MVISNASGVKKTGLPMSRGDRPASWISKHASVTFNQYGREFPNGGLNDAGLVVEVMWLDTSLSPAPDDRSSLSELQWIQYQLDTFASVAEMIEAAQRVRISTVYGKVHYLACDASSACAAFENLDGKLVITSGADLPARALTNHSYAQSLAHRRAQPRPPKGLGSLDRFARASRLAEDARGSTDGVNAAFTILDSVRGSETQWQIVYDAKRFQIHFRTAKLRETRTLDAKQLFVRCGQSARVLELDAKLAGDVTARFVPYKDELNRRIVDKSVAPIRDKIPAKAVDALVMYPASLSCQ